MKAVKDNELLDMLTEGLKIDGKSNFFDNAPGSCMALYCGLVHYTKYGPVFYLAHYVERNGSLMREPEMLFLKLAKRYYPVCYRNDLQGLDIMSVFLDEDPVRNEKAIQDDQAEFADIWLADIRDRQISSSTARLSAREESLESDMYKLQ